MSKLFASFTSAGLPHATHYHSLLIKQRQRSAFRAFRLCIACLAAIAASLPVYAQTKYLIAPDKSQVQFSLGGVHEVSGQFHVGSGEITFDRKTGAMTGTVQVDAASGNSDDQSRDKKMAKNELKAQVFPSITFTPTKFTGVLNENGDSAIQVQGTFTLIGKTHDITVPMTVHIDGSQCTAKGSFTIPYVAWGVKDPSMFMLKMEKEVKIDLAFNGSLSQ